LNKAYVSIISPATAKANNGNWQTASRWAEFLAADCRVDIRQHWSSGNDGPCDAMIALHARRSAASLANFHACFPERPSILVLTGTDLYRDIHHDEDARRSLKLATRLVLLQEAGLQELDAPLRGKACVIYQSAPALPAGDARADDGMLRVIMIGHLREEKDPATYLRAAALVDPAQVRLLQVGGALDAALGEQAQAAQRSMAHYRWLGALPHESTRRELAQSDVLVLTSRMEGGANVIIEAVTSGVPVLATDISGNRGMLGADYAGYFPVGNHEALAALIARTAADPAYLALLKRQCAGRAPLFSPQREQAAVRQLVRTLLVPNQPS
jgi:putative glycosyltransferase (TIGR04348 family)